MQETEWRNLKFGCRIIVGGLLPNTMSWMEILMDHCLQPHLHRFDG
jgi:hypothetical protein